MSRGRAITAIETSFFGKLSLNQTSRDGEANNQQGACGESAFSPRVTNRTDKSKKSMKLNQTTIFDWLRTQSGQAGPIFKARSAHDHNIFVVFIWEGGMPRLAKIPVARAEILASEPTHKKNCRRKLGMSWANPVKWAIPDNHSTTLQIKKPTASHLAMAMHLWNSVHVHPLNQFSKTLAFVSSSCLWKRRLGVHENSHVY